MTLAVKKISICVLALIFVALALLGVFDEIGKEYTDASFKRALLTFSVARGLNGVISVAQGTEVALEPAGIGVIFTPGQILDPVNDLIERFSWVMLASTTSLGVQALLLKVFSSLGFSLLVTAGVIIGLLMLWRPNLSDIWRRRAYRLATILLILRFMIPLMAISSEGFYQLFLESEYQASSAYLAQAQENLGRINDRSQHGALETEQLSWYDRLRRDLRATMDTMNVDQNVQALQAAVENLAEHTINLIVMFLVQTILFPLFFLWMAMKTIKAVLWMR